MTKKDFKVAFILLNVGCVAVVAASVLGGTFTWRIDVAGALAGIATVNGLFCWAVRTSGITSEVK